ncbi:serine protease [Nonomuraea sp. MG754425]|uniref:S8 family serine peptidase n=1 Tax=Nonomuraea sp. MG754425 TaxID=2570319 RepID=UPI001F021582|nr:S8 family serine peptidase [Nonomuraea sp. MG754425]MCF6473774.1 serine protease [Nonomuraea sp. MG754425]
MADFQAVVEAPPPRIFRLAHASRGAAIDSARLALPSPVTREWAWGSATGSGVRVCLIDSGVDAHHPRFTSPISTYTVTGDGLDVVPDEAGDQAGHGTACAGVIRAMAPGCELTSVRVLGGGLHGRGEVLLAALEWAIEQRFPLINLSLSTRRAEHKESLHDLVDRAFFAGVTIVASAHNRPVRSYPWHFASVISVGSHHSTLAEHIECNPEPPAEFFARGVQVEVPLPGGGTARQTGNSFATPHVTGLCARVLQRHPGFATGQLKHVLAAIADNRT